MNEKTVKEYSNGEISVIWKPDLCIHSGECVQNSPKVFNPDEKPWIKPHNSDSKQIMETVDKCPTGALSYRIEKAGLEKPEEQKPTFKIKIETMKGGPFIVPTAGVELFDSDGEMQELEGKTFSLCRCGASGNKPFCDGSHSDIDFEG